MTRWVALLRGVNVGGARKLPMADLKAFAEEIGLADVATLLASGNLIFSTTAAARHCEDSGLEPGDAAIQADVRGPGLLPPARRRARNDGWDGPGLETMLEREAKARLGLETDFLVRSLAELKQVVAANPFEAEARDHPSHLAVLFHREPVSATLLAKLTGAYDGPERVVAHGREMYVDYPDGQGRSKLGPAMAKLKFPRCATARNWNTVTKLAAL